MTRGFNENNNTTSAEDLKAKLLLRLPEVLRNLLPAGIAKCDTFTVGDVQGNKGKSLSVALHGPKVGQWHDFATGKGGDILHLWAQVKGLDTHRNFPEVVESVQAWLGEPYTKKVLPFKVNANLGPVTAQWNYTDADGELLARVYRYDPPGGKQYRPWDQKKGYYGLPNPRPLYNQVGLKSADTVILVEGEKAAQALIEARFCATTAMSGANAPIQKTDWSPLSNKHVVIWPDNDQPGLTYAQNVSEHLKTCHLASLAILKVPGDKPEKWDAADAVAEGMDIALFLQTADRVENYSKPAIPAYFAGHYLGDRSPMPPDIISPRILTPGGLLVLGGAPKVGKSDLLICWLAHLAAGIPFLGMTPPKPLKIFYLQTEIGYHYMRERLKNLDPSLMPLLDQNLVITHQVRMLLDKGGVEMVVQTISHFFDPKDVDIIVIDPLRNVYDGGPGGNENDNTAMLAFLQDRVEELRARVNPNAGIILAHHTKKIDKQSVKEDPFQAFSGASAIRSFYSTGILMFRPDETQSHKQLIFELRNGASLDTKTIDKIDGYWREIEHYSERLVNREYGEKLDAERRRKHDKILEILFDEGRKGTLYTSRMFTQVWEHKAGLGGRHSIRDRIEVLTSKGYIKFFKEGAARSRHGFLCVEGMEVPLEKSNRDPVSGEINQLFKQLLPTHFRSPSDGGLMPVENPKIWIYHEGACQ